MKIAADVIAPFLTEVFTISICAGMLLYDWKASRVLPIFKSGTKNDPIAITGLYRLFQLLQKILKKLFLTNYINIWITVTLWFLVNLDFEQSIVVIRKYWLWFSLRSCFRRYKDQAFDSNRFTEARNYGVNQNSLGWFDSYLTDRTQKCRVNVAFFLGLFASAFIFGCFPSIFRRKQKGQGTRRKQTIKCQILNGLHAVFLKEATVDHCYFLDIKTISENVQIMQCQTIQV